MARMTLYSRHTTQLPSDYVVFKTDLYQVAAQRTALFQVIVSAFVFLGSKQQKEFTSRGCYDTLFGKHCYLHGSFAHGFS